MTLPQKAVASTHDQDVRLMQLVAKGDPRARNMVAMRLCERLRRIEAVLLDHASDADDATQDSLVQVIRSAENYRGESSLERWADRIAVRTGLRFRQRERARNVVVLDEVVAPPGGDLHERLPRALSEYLGELPTTERRALFLKHALGYTVAEIAELTDTAQSTVKFWLVNGLKRIRKAIRRDVSIGAKGGRST